MHVGVYKGQEQMNYTRAVRRASMETRFGGVPDLIVADNVDVPVCCEVRQRAQPDGLEHHTLPTYCCVAVHHYSHNLE